MPFLSALVSTATQSERALAEFGVGFLFGAADFLGKLEISSEKVDVIADIPYGPDPAHRLDVLMPEGPTKGIAIHVHGGGFRLLSKDSHRHIAREIAARGYVTLNVNYRLAPEHKYPSALQDIASALEWAAANRELLGVEGSEVVLVGESAGAYLVMMTALAMSGEVDEAWARRIDRLGFRPTMTVPISGLMDMKREVKCDSKMAESEVERARLAFAGSADVPDPIDLLTTGARVRGLVKVVRASQDPLRVHSDALFAVLSSSASKVEMKSFDGPHSFHAFTWTDAARDAWDWIFPR